MVNHNIVKHINRFFLWYLMVLAILFTLLLQSKGTHPGMILGVVSLIAGGIILIEVLIGKKVSKLPGLWLLIILETFSIYVLNTDNDTLEIGVAVTYAIFSCFLLLKWLIRQWSKRY